MALGLDKYIPEGLRFRLSNSPFLIQTGVVLCLAGFSSFMLVATGMKPHLSSLGKEESFSPYTYPIVLGTVLGFAGVYYLFVFGFATRNYVRPRTEDMDPDAAARPSQMTPERGILDRGWLRGFDIMR